MGGSSGVVNASTITGRSAANASVERPLDLVRGRDLDAFQADEVGPGGVGHIGDGLGGLEAGVALHGPLLPGDLVEILVVEHHDHIARVGPRLVVLGGGQHLGHAAHLHGPVADHGHRHPVRKGELGRDPVRHAWDHGGQVPRQRRLHAPPDADVAGVPVGRGARVRRQDGLVGQVARQRREQPLGPDATVRSEGWPRSSISAHHSFTLLDDLVLPGAVRLCGAATAAVRPGCPWRRRPRPGPSGSGSTASAAPGRSGPPWPGPVVGRNSE